MPINAQVLLSVLSHKSTSGDISQTLRVTPATYALSLGDGTGANQAQVAWSDSRTFPAGGEDSFAIRSLTDDRGTVSITAVKVLYIKNTGSEQITIRAGGALQESWDGLGYSNDTGEPGETTLKAGAAIILADPTAAGIPANSSADTIYLQAAPGATYDIVLIGEGTIT